MAIYILPKVTSARISPPTSKTKYKAITGQKGMYRLQYTRPRVEICPKKSKTAFLEAKKYYKNNEICNNC